MVVDAKKHDTVSDVGADLVMVVDSVIRDYVSFQSNHIFKAHGNLDSLESFSAKWSKMR